MTFFHMALTHMTRTNDPLVFQGEKTVSLTGGRENFYLNAYLEPLNGKRILIMCASFEHDAPSHDERHDMIGRWI